MAQVLKAAIWSFKVQQFIGTTSSLDILCLKCFIIIIILKKKRGSDPVRHHMIIFVNQIFGQIICSNQPQIRNVHVIKRSEELELKST